MKIITTAIQKGGTGKTTCCVHLTHMLADAGLRVLLVDTDSQGNASGAFTTQRTTDAGASRLFKKKAAADLVLPSEKYERIAVIASDEALMKVGTLGPGTDEVFRDNVRRLGAPFDYVVIDTPPSPTLQMTAALVAAHYAFSPVVPDKYSIDGVDLLMNTIQSVQAHANPDLIHTGLLINRWNSRSGLQNEVVDYLKKNMTQHLVPFEIGERSTIGAAGFTGDPVWKVTGGAARTAAKEVRKALGWIIDRTKE